MTREEAIDILVGVIAANSEEENEALDMAIEALKRERTDEWCTGCKEYDTEKKCCPRFNKVIREAMKRIPHDDGTLEVKVEDATKVGRVLISDDKHRGGLYYPDEDEPQKSYPTEWCEQCNLWEDNKCVGVAQCKSNIDALKQAMDEDLIIRADAIRVVEKNSYRMAGLTEVKLKCEIEALPPADRSRGEWIPCEERLPSDNKAVLICDSGGNYFVGKLILTDTGYKWGIPLCTVWVDIEDGDAWMPLPEPYKESDDK